jgi:hypothetical protein
MNRRLLAAALLACLLLAGGVPVSRAEEPTVGVIGPGTRIELLTVNGTAYRQVVIRSLNAHTVVFTYTGGMTSVHLHDLPPEWQARFHFDPAAEAPADPTPVAAAPTPVEPATRATVPKKDVRFDAVLREFGHPAEVRAEVDLRPKFFQLDLGVKNQGRRPSCAIFAVVSALEYQNAELKGKPEKFSEEYLIWATRKSVQRIPRPGAAAADEAREDADEGFGLSEVVEALRAYGIPLQSSMPNTFGSKIEAIEDPPAKIIQEARDHQQVFVHPVHGRDPATRINNLVQALNAGIPVAIGLEWPNYRSIRNGFLDRQKPQSGSGHAVTLVGYRSATGRLEDAVFIFKNSYGVEWGQGGYGMVTYLYLSNNLDDAVLLEVQSGQAHDR